MDYVSSDDIKFKLPFGAIVSGSSNTGKTQFLLQLIKNADEMFEPKINDILYCYGQYGKHITELQNLDVKVHSGIPPDTLLDQLNKPFLLVLDDLIDSIEQKSLSSFFTRRNHHENFGVIVVTQNLFAKTLMVARNNSSYVILTRSPNALLQIRNFGVQIFPGKSQLNYFLDAYKDATSVPYGYLLVDLHPSTDSFLRLRTNIFPDDEEYTVFYPK
jgi:hypothetical protein